MSGYGASKMCFFGKNGIIGHIGQPLENNYSRMELFTKEDIPSKFDKIKIRLKFSILSGPKSENTVGIAQYSEKVRISMWHKR